MTLRVLSVVPRGYLPELRGGLEITAAGVADALASDGADVMVAAQIARPNLILRVSRKLFGPYVLRRRIGRHRAAYDRWHGGAIATLIQRHQPDCALCHVSFSAPVIEPLARARVPTLYYVHSNVIEPELVAASRDSPCLFAAESAFVAGKIEQAIGRPAFIIPPIIEPEAYRIEAGGNRVLVINPHPLKGGRIVAEVARLLPHRSFLVVGGWANARGHPESEAVEAELAACANVERVGMVQDMRWAFRQARFLFMPCIVEEAFGRAAAESCIAGIPVVGSDRGAIPETAGPGATILSADSSADAWANAVERLMTDEALHGRLSAQSLAHAAQPAWRPDHVRAAIMGTLRELAATPRG